jgi:hypothetical protein
MASESSGNACRGCELRRVIWAALRRFPRREEGGAREGSRGFIGGEHWGPVMASVTPGSNAGERYWEGEIGE